MGRSLCDTDNMAKVKIILLVYCMASCAGCAFIGVMTSPTFHEQKIPAEFELGSRTQENLLVFVDQPKGPGALIGFQPQLRAAIKGFLEKKVKIKSEYLVSQDKLSLLRGQRDDFALLSPVEIGRILEARIVLYVFVQDCELYELSDRGYYKGSLVTRSMLFDTDSGDMLWPEHEAGKVVRTKVEFETDGREATIRRLATATAHCVVRNFYNCPRDQFRTSDEENYGERF